MGSWLGTNSKYSKMGLGSFAGPFWPDALFLASSKDQQVFSQILLTVQIHLRKLDTPLVSIGRLFFFFFFPITFKGKGPICCRIGFIYAKLESVWGGMSSLCFSKNQRQGSPAPASCCESALRCSLERGGLWVNIQILPCGIIRFSSVTDSDWW